MTSYVVDALCAGGIAPLPDGKRSAIAKHPQEGPVRIDFSGIEQDRQANRKHHGYPAMALHQFPFQHHCWLADIFDNPTPLGQAGGMGENISCSGLMESDVHIGDRFRLGTALIEVTQPRQPCATIERHLQRKGVVAAIVKAGKSGWFYRVLEPGSATAGDSLTLEDRGSEDWTVERAFLCVYGKAKGSPEELEALAALPCVSDRLVLDIEKRLRR